MNSELDILLEVPGSMPLNIVNSTEEDRMEEVIKGEGGVRLKKLNHESQVELSTLMENSGHATVT